MNVSEMVEDVERVKECKSDLELIDECRSEIEYTRNRIFETEKLLNSLNKIEVKLRVKLNNLWVNAYKKIKEEKYECK